MSREDNSMEKRNGAANGGTVSEKVEDVKVYEMEIVWRNVWIFAYLHLAALYGIHQMIWHCKWTTVFWSISLLWCGGLGITAGCHRLWCHKSYQAKLPLRILLAIFNSIAVQNDIYEWVRDHRVHHKYSDTDADPHNASRGFFFSHIGWLLVKKHNDVKEKGKTIEMGDVWADPVVRFQRKNYLVMAALFSFVLPTVIPYYFWNEDIYIAWYVAVCLRYMASLHLTWCINSAAHIWGMKPYDKNFRASENFFVALFVMGEGWHNYHHVFPWDYKTSESPTYETNISTGFIDLMAWIGWAYNLKMASQEMIMARAKRTGDGSYKFKLNKDIDDKDHDDHFWGWDDPNIDDNYKKLVSIKYKVEQQKNK